MPSSMSMVEYDEGGLPVHVGIGINKDGQGPVDEDDPQFDRIICWCIDGDECKKYPGAVDG